LAVGDIVVLSAYATEILSGTYRVASAANGREGLEKAFALRPDVIVSDLQMPIMNGQALLRELRSHPEMDALPVLLLTARDDEDLRVSLLRQGAHDYLVKPFVPAELLARLGNLVAIKRARDVLQMSLDSHQLDVERLASELARRNRDLQTAHDAMRVARDQAERASHLKATFLRPPPHAVQTPPTTLQLHPKGLAPTGGRWNAS